MIRFLNTGLLGAVSNATAAEIVGGEFYSHPISGEDADIVLAHLSRDMGENNVPVIQLNFEHCVRQWLDDTAFNFNGFFF